MNEAVLVIENATDMGSVALLRNGEVIATVEFPARDPVTGTRTEGLVPAVARCLSQACMTAAAITGVVCGAGPGGFTSLRCAAAVAKGLCSPRSIPLYAVSSLELLAWSVELSTGEYVAAIAAGRGQWFASAVHCGAGGERAVSAVGLVTGDGLRDLASVRQAKLVGAGLDIDAYPRAAAALACIEQIRTAGPVSLERWEPDYGRLAEAQAKWEAVHGRPLAV